MPLGRYAEEALAAWLAPEGRGRLAPPAWRRRGDAEAVFLNARGGRLSRQGAFGVVRARAAPPGWATGSAPTCCATPAPPTCWPTGPTSGWSRSCSATPPSPPPSSTPRSPPSTSGPPTSRPTPGPPGRPAVRPYEPGEVRASRLWPMANDAPTTDPVSTIGALLEARAVRPQRAARRAGLRRRRRAQLRLQLRRLQPGDGRAGRGRGPGRRAAEALARWRRPWPGWARAPTASASAAASPSAPARLEAMPAARRCIACASLP